MGHVSMFLRLIFLVVSADAAWAFTHPHAAFGLRKAGTTHTAQERIIHRYMSTTDERETTGTKSAKKQSHGILQPTSESFLDESSPFNPLDLSEDPLVNNLREVRSSVTSCPELWRRIAKLCPTKRALLDEHLCEQPLDLTFEQVEEAVRRSAGIFSSLGIRKSHKISVFGDNSAHWLIVDHGIQSVGAVSVVRGAGAPMDELRYIFDHSDSREVVVLQGPSLLKDLAEDAAKIGLKGLGLGNEPHGEATTVILMHRENMSEEERAQISNSLGINVFVLADLLNSTPPLASGDLPVIGREDLSTIVYTSGTTGHPKGVMLTHGNLLHQVGLRFAPTKPFDESEPLPGEIMLSLLPVWHITERAAELCILSRGCTLVYSTIRHFKTDLAKHKPHLMMLVPRVLEKVARGVEDKLFKKSAAVRLLVRLFTATGTARATNSKIAAGLVVGEKTPNRFRRWLARLVVAVLSPLNSLGNKLVWGKVQTGLGGNQKVIMSGGSALAGSLESFYEVCGIPLLVGYGLTETSPLIAHRRSDSNLVAAGCIGKPIVDTEVRVVNPKADPNEGERPSLPEGTVGTLLVRGPQVMRGYYKDEAQTNVAIDRFGWFNTGDLAKINPATGDLIIVGRCKDTIVLSNGENVEPTPIEDAIMTKSKLIDQVMLAGQDQKQLSAIAVLNPVELVNSGYLDGEVGKSLQKASDRVSDPKCTDDECERGCKELVQAAKVLHKNEELASALRADVAKACEGFRKWEQVGNIYITLEPFAMANGLLTQSYKVKRHSVIERYEEEMSKGWVPEGGVYFP